MLRRFARPLGVLWVLGTWFFDLTFCESDSSTAMTASLGRGDPINRVVNMLQSMSQKVQKHVQDENGLFDKAMCSCKVSLGQLEASVSEAKEKIPQLTSNGEGAVSLSQGLEAEVAEHQKDQDLAIAAIAEEKEMRKKQEDAFVKEKEEIETNIKGLEAALQAFQGKADKDPASFQAAPPDERDEVPMAEETIQDSPAKPPRDAEPLEEHLGDSSAQTDQPLKETSSNGLEGLNFLQREASKENDGGISMMQRRAIEKARDIVQAMNPARFPSVDRDTIASLLEQLDRNAESDAEEDSGVVSGVPELLGRIGQMRATFQEQLKNVIEEESRNGGEYVTLIEGKQDVVDSLGNFIDKNKGRLSETKLEIVQMNEELESLQASLSKDVQMLQETTKNCHDRQEIHDERITSFTEENRAILETIDILRKDQVLSNTAVSFLQVDSASRSDDNKAIKVLTRLVDRHPGLSSFRALAQQAATASQRIARKRGHGRASQGFGKIKELISRMRQVLENDQVDDDTKKANCEQSLTRETSQHDTQISQLAAQNAEIVVAMNTLEDVRSQMEALKKTVKELDNSVAENGERRKQENAHYTHLLSENNQALAVLQAAKERMEETYGGKSLISTAHGTNDEFGFFALRQGGSRNSVQKKLTKEAQIVVRMLTTIMNDIKRQGEDLKKEEAESQRDYEELVKVSKEKRQTNTEEMSAHATILAETSENTRIFKKRKKFMENESKETLNVINDLKKDCESLLDNYAMRKSKRKATLEDLAGTQAVLNGAGGSLVEVRAHRHRHT